MNLTKHAIKRTAITTAITAALGTTAIPDPASAANLTFSFDGLFTMINSLGDATANTDGAGKMPWYTARTVLAGTMNFDTDTGTGTGTFGPFSFFGKGFAEATTISFQAIGNGFGGAGSLILANMGFNWNKNNAIPVSLVMDAEGLFNAIGPTGTDMAVGETVGQAGSDIVCGTDISCALPATNDQSFGPAMSAYTLPIGPSPAVSTTWNTSTIGGVTCTLGCNPSGTLPLLADTIGGSPMPAGPFAGFNANFDMPSLTLLSDGSGSITAPADVSDTVPQVPGPPKTQSVNLGVPTDVAPPDTAEYCLTGIADCDANGWTANLDTGANNPVDVDITQTINELTVDWRAGDGVAFAIQKVTSTVDDTIPPVITDTPMDISVNVPSTSEEVCFSNDAIGHLTATDIWDADPAILYSLNGFDFFPSDPVEDCSDQFGPNANTVFWRAVDVAGNIDSYEQTVTLNLPGGIVGKACELDLDYEGFRLLAGNFIMRGASGSQVGATDNTVTGDINTFPYPDLCTEQGIVECPVVGASLETTQPFEGLLWTAAPIWLYGPGDWTFETCPGDASTQCDNDPRPLSMTVLGPLENNGVPQLGAHMLFEWGSTQDIDVVVVWNVDCGTNQLTTTDPDGDGILGTPMVDGPFIGFNAAFDQSATGLNAQGDLVPLIADGGYVTEIPAYKNPIRGASPLPLVHVRLDADDIPVEDSDVADSCVGGCYDFITDGLIDATDANGDYQFAQVVLPLDDIIPFWSLFRKFDETRQIWVPFLVDERNSVKTALKNENGFCPEPGSGGYMAASFNSQLAGKLTEDDNCVELTIEKDGPNDTIKGDDRVTDPGGVAKARAPARPSTKTTNGGVGGGSSGCSIAGSPLEPAQRGEWWLLGGLLAFLGWRRRKQH